jgi:hypothetical protein
METPEAEDTQLSSVSGLAMLAPKPQKQQVNEAVKEQWTEECKNSTQHDLT